MSSIVTVPERKARETESRRQAVAAVTEDLRDFVRSHGGRFHVFGSVAEDRLRHDSDVDILIDVPPAFERAAWEQAEQAGRRHRIAVDIPTTAYASPAFVARVKSCSIVIA